MARLPQPGGDSGTWGDVLNDYLSQVHKADGTLKDNTVTASAIAPNTVTATEIQNGSITEAQLDAATQTKLNTAGSGNVADGTITNAKLHDDAVTDAKVAPGAAIAQSKIADLTTDLAAKANASHGHTVSQISDSTTTGRSLLTADDAAAARTAIGAGTSNLVIGTTSTTAKAGNYAPTKADVGLGNVDNTSDNDKPIGTATQTALNAKAALSHTHTAANINDSTSTGRAVLTAADAIAARTAIGAGASNLAIGTTSNTAKAGDYQPAWSDITSKPAVLASGANTTAARAAIGAVGKGELVFSVKDYGAVGDGITDDTAALEDAFDSVPSGATLLFPPGRYNITSPLVSIGKTLNIEAYGATVIRAGTGSAIAIEGAFDSTINVSSLTETTTTIDEAAGILTTTLSLASVPGWARGDLVKLVADDEIPGVRPLEGSSLMRVGQHFFVHSSSGTTVVLVGRVRDPFTTNLRIARMQQLSTRINGLHIESPTPFTGTGNYLRVSAMVRPRVNITMGSFPATGVAFKGCYAPQCNLVADCANDLPLSSQFGYALTDGGSEFGVFHIVASNVRHAYTDGSSVIPAGEVNLGSYGRPYGHVVSGTAYGSVATAWDTHNSAKGIIFRNCQAFNCDGGFALRGVECSVIGGVVDNCGFGLYIFDEDGKNGVTSKDSYSYGHYVDGLIVRRPKGRGLDITANLDGPLVNVREGRVTTIRNVTIIDCPANEGFVVRVANQAVSIDNLHVVAPATVTNHYVVRAINSEIKLSNVTLDYRAHTSGTVYHAYDVNSTYPSVISIKGLDVKVTAEAAALITNALQGQSNTHWEVSQAESSEVVSLINTSGYDASSSIRWLNKSDGTNEAYRSMSGTNIETTASTLRLCISDKPLIVGRCAPSGANRSLAKLGTGKFVGQELMILNVESSSGNTVTVVHSTTTRLTWNVGETNVVLNNLQYAKWMWTGSYWMQTIAPTGFAH